MFIEEEEGYHLTVSPLQIFCCEGTNTSCPLSEPIWTTVVSAAYLWVCVYVGGWVGALIPASPHPYEWVKVSMLMHAHVCVCMRMNRVMLCAQYAFKGCLVCWVVRWVADGGNSQAGGEASGTGHGVTARAVVGRVDDGLQVVVHGVGGLGLQWGLEVVAQGRHQRGHAGAVG